MHLTLKATQKLNMWVQYVTRKSEYGYSQVTYKLNMTIQYVTRKVLGKVNMVIHNWLTINPGCLLSIVLKKKYGYSEEFQRNEYLTHFSRECVTWR
jgi:hypothetical protein